MATEDTSDTKDKKSKDDNSMILTCEWSECEEVHHSMDAFITHVTGHLKEISPPEGDKDNECGCEWRECGHVVSSGFTELIRHVYFHAFHVRIKYLGMQLILQKKLPSCQLDAGSRNIIPELPEAFQCCWKYCMCVFDNPDYFYAHVKAHCEIYPAGKNVEGGVKCEWEGCSTVVKSRHKLRDHVKSHTQEKVVACPTCGSLLSTPTKLLDHLHRQSEAETHTYQCSHCNKRFSSERLLRDHMRNHVNRYKCPFCEMTSNSPYNLKIHVQYRHTNERSYNCDVCNKYSAKTPLDLRRHLETHKTTFYTCMMEGCKFKSKVGPDLKVHMKRAHSNETKNISYVCHICDKTYTKGCRLTDHLKETHDFKWPSGHRRFRYKLCDDGLYRLQTIRYESSELHGEDTDDSTCTQTRSKSTKGRRRSLKAENIIAKPTFVPSTSSRTNKSPKKNKTPVKKTRKAYTKKKGVKTRSKNNGKRKRDNEEENEESNEEENGEEKKEDFSYNLEMLGDVALHMGLIEQAHQADKTAETEPKTEPKLSTAEQVFYQLGKRPSADDSKLPPKKRSRNLTNIDMCSSWNAKSDNAQPSTENIDPNMCENKQKSSAGSNQTGSCIISQAANACGITDFSENSNNNDIIKSHLVITEDEQLYIKSVDHNHHVDVREMESLKNDAMNSIKGHVEDIIDGHSINEGQGQIQVVNDGDYTIVIESNIPVEVASTNCSFKEESDEFSTIKQDDLL